MRYIIRHTSNNCTFYNIHKLLLDKSLASLRLRVGPTKRLTVADSGFLCEKMLMG